MNGGAPTEDPGMSPHAPKDFQMRWTAGRCWERKVPWHVWDEHFKTHEDVIIEHPPYFAIEHSILFVNRPNSIPVRNVWLYSI